MNTRRHILGRVFGSLLTAASLALTSCLSGCPNNRPEQTLPLPQAKEVPQIRVLITNAPSLVISTTGGYRIWADRAVVASSPSPLPSIEVSFRGTWLVGASAYAGSRLTVDPVGGAMVRVGGNAYRGRITIISDGDGIQAINVLDLETYLAGVVQREMFPNWQPAAYQAQAIAARTYAMYEMSLDRSRPYNVRSDQASQMYGGSDAETDKSWRAVRSTRGMVLVVGSSGSERIIRAYYSSTCGGLSNSAYVLNGPRIASGPLAGGHVCRDCANAPHYRWPAIMVPKAVVARALRAGVLPSLSGVSTITVTEQTGERPVWINVTDTNGKNYRIRAEDLRLALLRDGANGAGKSLYSMNCRIRDTGSAIAFENGRGFGHGVGMCQWGAEGMAMRGCSGELIVTSYYPGARLFRAY